MSARQTLAAARRRTAALRTGPSWTIERANRLATRKWPAAAFPAEPTPLKFHPNRLNCPGHHPANRRAAAGECSSQTLQSVVVCRE